MRTKTSNYYKDYYTLGELYGHGIVLFYACYRLDYVLQLYIVWLVGFYLHFGSYSFHWAPPERTLTYSIVLMIARHIHSIPAQYPVCDTENFLEMSLK